MASSHLLTLGSHPADQRRWQYGNLDLGMMPLARVAQIHARATILFYFVYFHQLTKVDCDLTLKVVLYARIQKSKTITFVKVLCSSGCTPLPLYSPLSLCAYCKISIYIVHVLGYNIQCLL